MRMGCGYLYGSTLYSTYIMWCTVGIYSVCERLSDWIDLVFNIQRRRFMSSLSRRSALTLHYICIWKGGEVFVLATTRVKAVPPFVSSSAQLS